MRQDSNTSVHYDAATSALLTANLVRPTRPTGTVEPRDSPYSGQSLAAQSRKAMLHRPEVVRLTGTTPAVQIPQTPIG